MHDNIIICIIQTLTVCVLTLAICLYNDTHISYTPHHLYNKPLIRNYNEEQLINSQNSHCS